MVWCNFLQLLWALAIDGGLDERLCKVSPCFHIGSHKRCCEVFVLCRFLNQAPDNIIPVVSVPAEVCMTPFLNQLQNLPGPNYILNFSN